MTAITTRRRADSAEAEQLRAELAEARAELAELRAAVRAAAALVINVAVIRAPQGFGGHPRDVAGVARMYGLGPGYAAALEALFAPGT
jgi:hypothetical protein